jgi:ankyrin repeat protein
MIAHGAEVNARHAEAGSTPLDYAVIKDNRDVAELLLAHGAAVEAADRRTPSNDLGTGDHLPQLQRVGTPETPVL